MNALGALAAVTMTTKNLLVEFCFVTLFALTM